MDSPSCFEQEVLIHPSEAFYLLPIFERGLQYAQQGLYHESASIFRFMREQLSTKQSALIAILDAYILSYTNYRQAQHTLQQASKRFVEVDTIHQYSLEALRKLLPTLRLQESATQSSPSAPTSMKTPNRDTQVLPALSITCFGRFTVSRLESIITLCTNRSGQTMLRYLIAQPDHSATIDKLVHALWPEEEMDSALHKLRIAASALRRSLNDGYDCACGGYLLCKNRAYQLHPDITLLSDVAEFLKFYHTGLKAERDRAVTYYEKACQLYTGPFLSEDMYADWSFFQREKLGQAYLTMCSSLATYYLDTHCYTSAVQWASTILKENKCDETAHQQLMRAYAAEGRRAEALRQYQRCQQVLDEELGISPTPETLELSQMIQNGTFSTS